MSLFLKMKRKRSLKALKRDLDSAFSRFIRQRDSSGGNQYGFYGPCVTCSKVNKLEAGHFIPRQHLSVRWDARNVHGQCSYCNRWLHGNLLEYTLYMQKTYGQEVIDELRSLKNTTKMVTRSDMEELLEKYR